VADPLMVAFVGTFGAALVAGVATVAAAIINSRAERTGSAEEVVRERLALRDEQIDLKDRRIAKLESKLHDCENDNARLRGVAQ